MEQSAVFFDIDGTIWDYKHSIPESTVKAIQTLRAKGHYAFLSSGRSRSTIRAKELLDIGFDGILAGCGTYIEYRGKVLLNEKLPWDLLCRTIPVLKKHRIATFFEGSSKLYVDKKAFGDDPYAKSFEKELGEDYLDITDLNPDSIVNKLSIDYRHVERETMLASLQEDYDVIVHDFGSVAELLPKGFSKATGIDWICDYLGISPSCTYAFGDSANDITMLQRVHCGIAMGNASEVTKEAADYVTTSMQEDGIYNGLLHVGLI
ncbi:MAG: Cof-type HAD-IIB family hydrolase [Lachnospiraceae bacterium]|nr:Cof-type HAD-IIB family hydrolase [Lachnospiraceae bacterium]